MPTDNNRIKLLLEKYSAHTATEDEVNELFNAIRQSENDEFLKEWLHKAIADTQPAGNYDEAKWNKVISGILTSEDTEVAPDNHDSKVYKIFSWRRIAVAVSILLVMGIGAYFLFFTKNEKQNPATEITSAAPQDIKPPETNRAMITLTNGQKVYLDSASNGTLLQHSGIEIVKLADGKIEYRGAANELIYNTLSNPRGSKVIDMALADGSHVWLNAGSSVTFPVAFIGNERKVSITGEAYFEIAPDAAKPFFVNKGDVEIKVLGTHFNVNAFDDEDDIKVTLLEGSVEVKSHPDGYRESKVKIKPGDQAVIQHSACNIQHNADIEQVMAWKDGLFNFDKTEIGSILKQLERWYDMNVEYEGTKPNITLSGIISRNVNISKVLEMLELSGLHCRIEGNKIIVLK